MTQQFQKLSMALCGTQIHDVGTLTATQAACDDFRSVTCIGADALVIDSFDAEAEIVTFDDPDNVAATAITLQPGQCLWGKFKTITTSAGRAALIKYKI